MSVLHSHWTTVYNPAFQPDQPATKFRYAPRRSESTKTDPQRGSSRSLMLLWWQLLGRGQDPREHECGRKTLAAAARGYRDSQPRHRTKLAKSGLPIVTSGVFCIQNYLDQCPTPTTVIRRMAPG